MDDIFTIVGMVLIISGVWGAVLGSVNCAFHGWSKFGIVFVVSCFAMLILGIVMRFVLP